MINRVAVLLFLALLTTSLLPMLGAYYLIDYAMKSQQSIYRSPRMRGYFDEAQRNLKTLSKLKPSQEARYRKQFNNIQDMKLIYGDDNFFAENLNAVISRYFLWGLGIATFLATLLGLIISFVINKLYANSIKDLNKQRDRAYELTQIAKWQEIAKKMVHEIRRPLQPISIWTSNLRNAFDKTKESEFRHLLEEGTLAIDEEVAELDLMMKSFSRFANLPKAKIKRIEVSEVLKEFKALFLSQYPEVDWFFEEPEFSTFILADERLLKLSIVNLVENAMEANSGKKISITVLAKLQDKDLVLEVYNTGCVISKENSEKIFDLYYSSKAGKKNSGLGLAIVKAAMVEQNGQVFCVPEDNGARFQLIFPQKFPSKKE